MINAYCRVCGLYISVQDEFGGGKGACPRCRTRLRIPPLVESHPDLPRGVQGFRLIAEPEDSELPGGIPELVQSKHGPSDRYECGECQAQYESLRNAGEKPDQCPVCGATNTPMTEDVDFYRPGASDDAPDEPEELPASNPAGSLPMREGYLVAQPADDQTEDESVVEGVLASAEADQEGAAGQEETRRQEAVEMDRDVAPAMEDGTDLIWSYLLNGQQHGPVDTEEMISLLQAGKINPSVLVWRKGVEGWHPAEEFEALAPGMEKPVQDATSTGGESIARLRRHAVKACNQILSMMIIGVVITLAIAGMQSHFTAVKGKVFLVLDLVLAGVMLLALVYAGLQYRRYAAVLHRAGGRRCGRGLLGIGGLLACLVTAVVLASLPRPGPPAPTLETPIDRAQSVFEVLSEGKAPQTFAMVDWKRFRYNDEEFGLTYRSLVSQEARTRAVEAFLQRFAREVNPGNYMASGANGLQHWKITSRTGETVQVVAEMPGQGPTQWVEMTLDDGKLVALRAYSDQPESDEEPDGEPTHSTEADQG